MSLLDRWIASFQSRPTPKAKGPKMVECAVCEKWFEKKRNSKTCSPVCSRKYRQRPEAIERRRERDLERFRKRYQRPEVKARISEYGRKRYQRPEVRERVRETSRKRFQRPEVREGNRERCRLHNTAKRLGISARRLAYMKVQALTQSFKEDSHA